MVGKHFCQIVTDDFMDTIGVNNFVENTVSYSVFKRNAFYIEFQDEHISYVFFS